MVGGGSGRAAETPARLSSGTCTLIHTHARAKGCWDVRTLRQQQQELSVRHAVVVNKSTCTVFHALALWCAVVCCAVV